MKIKVLELKDEMDESGDVMSTSAVVTFPLRIPLVQEFSFKKIIGYATLIREENCFFIKDISPVALSKPSGKLLNKDEFIDMIKITTPAIGGVVFKKFGNIVTKFSINNISLNMSPNSDSAIKSIGEQLNDSI